MWYTSGKGCPQGNKCSLQHKKWDETVKANKGRCYVCGDRSHRSRYCERPGGGEEGSDVLTREQRVEMFSLFRRLPPRPNGEEVSLTAPDESRQELFLRQEKDQRRVKNQRACQSLKTNIIRSENEGLSFDEAIQALMSLVNEEYFEGRDAIPAFVEEILIRQEISKTRRKIEEITKEGLVERATRRSSRSPVRSRINMVKVIKVELEEEEPSFQSYWKGVLMLFGVQLITSWLYSQCQKRRAKKKNTKEEDVAEEEINDQDEEKAIHQNSLN